MPATSERDTGPERVGVPLDPALQDLHHLKFKLALLAVWTVASFGVGWFAEYLQFRIGPWPFSYWMAAQGGILVFIVLAWVYFWAMRRFDRQAAQQRDAVGPHV